MKSGLLKTTFAMIFASLMIGVASLRAEEIPSLEEKVKSGELPPMAERLPKEPLVLDYSSEHKSVGKYGGDLNILMGKPKDTRQMAVYSYARLVGYGPDFELHPDIVASFDVVEGRQFTFTLREGHKWSDGHPLTTEDFRYFWEDMMKNPDLGRKGLPEELIVDGEEPVFEVLDERTFRYTWSKPNPSFLPALAGAAPLYIYRPAHYLKQFHIKYNDPDKLAKMAAEAEAKDWASLHTRKQRQRRSENPDLPTLQAWWNRTPPPSTRYVFERNPYYHRVDPKGRQLPYIDNVIMNIVSKEVIPAKTGTGESDLQARYLRFDHVPFLKQAEKEGKIKVFLWSLGYGSQIALFPNLQAKDPQWRKLNRDVRYRRALSLAINREEINEVIYFGLATPSANTVLPQSPLYKEEFAHNWTQYDPDQANALLDELGLEKRNASGTRLFPDGQAMQLIIETSGDSTEESDVLELIADQYRKIGINVFVSPSQRDIFRRRVYAGESVMSVFNGLNNALASPDMNPEELAPTDQAQLQWSGWGQYNMTGGKAGEAIDIDIAQQQMDLFHEWMVSQSSTKRKDIWQTMLHNYTDQVFSIGVVNNSRQPVVISPKMQNVPEEGIYAWQPSSIFGVYRMDTFWFEE